MKIAIIGFGNLGKAFVKGVLTKNITDNMSIYVCAKSQETIASAVEVYDVHGVVNVQNAIDPADIVVLAIRSDAFFSIADEIKKCNLDGKIIISFMAGMTTKTLHAALGREANIVRAMPNLAIEKGQGVIALVVSDHDNEQNLVISLLSQLGLVVKIKEEDIEKVTALSACGLGFAAYLMSIFIQVSAFYGLDVETSTKLVSQTFQGAITLGDFDELVTAVSTKGGATEKGIEYLKKNHMDEIILNAIQLAYEKAQSIH